ncbi:MAG: tyrosine-type recombinase/integrase [Dehalobacter sp.]|nr:tyrosine-type recombinase/integrase [Dehalobacter sp.]
MRLFSGQAKPPTGDRKLFKKSYDNTYTDYVCVDEMGKLFHPNYITRHFGYLLKRYQFRKIRFHDLHHSCASLFLTHGIPMKAIQEWLGHSTFATTADIYSHVDFSSKQESVKPSVPPLANRKNR